MRESGQLHVSFANSLTKAAFKHNKTHAQTAKAMALPRPVDTQHSTHRHAALSRVEPCPLFQGPDQKASFLHFPWACPLTMHLTTTGCPLDTSSVPSSFACPGHVHSAYILTLPFGSSQGSYEEELATEAVFEEVVRLCKRELSYKQENVSREARQGLVGKLTCRELPSPSGRCQQGGRYTEGVYADALIPPPPGFSGNRHPHGLRGGAARAHHALCPAHR